MDNTNNMNNMNNFNNQNNMNYNAYPDQQMMNPNTQMPGQPMTNPNVQMPDQQMMMQQPVQQQDQQEAIQNANLGFCPRCGQKLSNPKYCMHCGTQTDVLLNQQVNHKKEQLDNERKEIKRKANIYANVYYVFFALEVIGMIILYKYFISEIMVLGFSVIFGGEMTFLHFICIIIPVTALIAYLIVCVKALIYSLVYLKFEVTIKGILTIIISFIGLSSIIFGLVSLLLA